MSTDDRISLSLPELLDRVLAADDLTSAVKAATGWWRQRCPDQALLIGVLDDDPASLVTAAGHAPAGALSLREMLTRQLGLTGETVWFPLGKDGAIIGGIVLAKPQDDPPVEESIPTLWIDMTSRLLADARGRSERLRSAKLSAMAEFAAGAGHEINNPLATIVGRTRELAASESDPERRRVLSAIGSQAWRIRDMIGDTMLFGRPPEPQIIEVDFVRTIQAVISRFTEEIDERGIKVDSSEAVAEAIVVSADETQLAIVLSELLRNALRAVPDGGCITIGLRQRRFFDEPVAELTVSDNGPGLTEKDREHLFDPFYSGRQAGRGLGFGLSKCWRIVTQHGGTLRVGSTPQGTKFTVRWPEATAAQATLPLRAMRNLG